MKSHTAAKPTNDKVRQAAAALLTEGQRRRTKAANVVESGIPDKRVSTPPVKRRGVDQPTALGRSVGQSVASRATNQPAVSIAPVVVEEEMVFPPDMTPPQIIAALVRCVQDATRNIVAAGQLIVMLMDRHGWTHKQIAGGAGFSTQYIGNFERVGRKRVLPQLAMGDATGHKYLARLPIEEQRRWIVEPIPVAKADGGEMLVHINDFNLALAMQVFVQNRMRSIPEQRAWLEANVRRPHPMPARVDWRVMGGQFHTLTANVVLDRATFIKAAVEMGVLSPAAAVTAAAS